MSEQCRHCAPKAWDYPPRGSITASCGHRVYDDCGETIAIASFDSFSDGSYGPCIDFGSYCPPCAIRVKTSYLVFEDEESGDRWLDSVSHLYSGGFNQAA